MAILLAQPTNNLTYSSKFKSREMPTGGYINLVSTRTMCTTARMQEVEQRRSSCRGRTCVAGDKSRERPCEYEVHHG